MSSFGTRIEPLNRENFDTWRLQAEAILTREELWGYVSGEIARPAASGDNDSTQRLMKQWIDGDKKAKANLILIISATELKHVRNCTTSKDVWDKLTSIYLSSGPAKKVSLLKRLTGSKMEEHDDVRAHMAMFQDIIDKLGEMYIEINEELLSVMLLNSLPYSWSTFRCAVETRDELPKYEVLKVKILENVDFKHKERSNGEAYFAGKSNKHTYQKAQNVTRVWDQNKTLSNRRNVVCYRCGKKGHIANSCRSRFVKQPEQNAGKAEEEIAFLAENVTFKKNWCLDSGCTSHLCNDKNMFHEFESHKQQLHLADKSMAMVEGQGTVILNVFDGENNRKVRLEKTLYVPNLRKNLISVSKIATKGFRIDFSSNEAMIKTPKGNVIARAKRQGELYYLNVAEDECMSVEENRLGVWHSRFAHLNGPALSKTLANMGVKTDSKLDTLKDCTVCLLGKKSEKKFSSKTDVQTKAALELVHSDVCGPMQVASIGGAKYMVTFTDDFSRYTEVYFLKQKSGVFDAFREYKASSELLTGNKIKQLQSDNGGEYLSKEFDDFLRKCGIKRRLTVPQTPQQNGISERKNRSLLDAGRCILIESKLPLHFWAEAVHAACFCRNRAFSKILKSSPFAVWTQTKPDGQQLKVFGCTAYALDKDTNRGKFDPKSEECINLGYSDNYKAYRLWNCKKGKVIIARSVYFFEDKIEGIENKKTKADKLESYLMAVDFFGVKQDHDEKDKDLLLLKNCSVQLERLEETPRNDIELEREPGILPDFHADSERHGYNLRELPCRSREISNAMVESSEITDIGDDFDQCPFSFFAFADAPSSVEEALSGSDKEDWIKAIAAEITAHIECNSWEIVPKRGDVKEISSKTLLTRKYDENGNFAKLKARVVARGCFQRYGTDYVETYAPVARFTSIRMLMAYAAMNGCFVHQMDIICAYLHGEIDAELYMKLPDCLGKILDFIIENKLVSSKDMKTAQTWKKRLSEKISMTCLVKRSIYGLKQAGRQWNIRLDQELKALGLSPLNSDPCVYKGVISNKEVIMAVYVDDLIIASKDQATIDSLKQKLSKPFKVKDMGKIHFCLGVRFKQNLDFSIEMSQDAYVDSILKRYGMTSCKPSLTPLDGNQKLDTPIEVKDLNKPYQQLIGSLMYLSVSTRPDLSYPVSFLSQFLSQYGKEHWKAAKRVVRYLKNTKHLGLKFAKSDAELQGFADADWAQNKKDRRSYTGYVFTWSNSPVAWESRKQRCVALSSTEAELSSVVESIKEATYLFRFMNELGTKQSSITIFNDNQSAQALLKTFNFTGRSKHFELRYHFVKEKIASKEMIIDYMDTAQMPADFLTKALFSQKHNFCIQKLGMVDSQVCKERHLSGGVKESASDDKE